MGVNISGKGAFSGLGSLVAGIVDSFILLASKILGFTSVTTVDVQKNSIISSNPYAPLYISKSENPFSWQEDSINRFTTLAYGGYKYLGKKLDNTFYFSDDMKTFTDVTFSLALASQVTTTIEDFSLSNNEIKAALPNGLFIIEHLYEFVENVGWSRELFVSNSSGSLFSISGPTGYMSDQNAFLRYLGSKNGYDFVSVYTNGTGKVFKTQITSTNMENLVYQEVLSASGVVFESGINGYSFSYENGIYALVGYEDSAQKHNLYRSTNGTSFTYANDSEEIFGDSHKYFALTGINNKFVAVVPNWTSELPNKIMYSDDAITWTPVVTSGFDIPFYPGQNYKSVSPLSMLTINNKLMLGVTGTSSFVTSQDGVNWSVEEANNLIDSYGTRYFAGNVTVTLDLAGGSSYYTTLVDSTGPGFLLTSTFGGNFTVSNNKIEEILSSGADFESSLTPISLPTSDYVSSGVFGQEKYILSTGIGSFISEDNGQTWTTSYTEAGYFTQMVYGNGIFVGINQDREIYYSADGINWLASTYTTTNIGLGNLLFNISNNTFYALDRDNVSSITDVIYSSDGLNWSSVTTDRFIGSMILHSSTLFATTYDPTDPSPEVFLSLIFDNGATIYDQPVSLPLNYIGELLSTGGELIYRNELLFYVSSNGGYNWTAATQPPTSGGTAVYADGKIILKGSQETFISTSPYLEYIEYPTTSFNFVIPGQVGSLVETQVSIGDQGSGTAEVLTPVKVYAAPPTSEAIPLIEYVTVKNTSIYPVLFDLAIINSGMPGREQMNSSTLAINDQPVASNQTITVLSDFGRLYEGETITILPSSIDALEVKVYGTFQ